MKRPRFLIRTIRNGQVRILHHDYQCRQDASQFDGMRAAFGLYWNGDRQTTFVCLWGSEDQYRAQSEEEMEWPGPFCDDDGTFKWEWWDRV